MKTKIQVSFLAVGFSFVLLTMAGCPEVGPDDMASLADQPTAAALITLVTETDPFQQWSQFPGVQGVVESAAPHGPMGRTWINSVVEGAISVPVDTLPADSVILKENLSESTPPAATTWSIMWKVSGFDAENNDWFWAEVTPDGDVLAEGKVDMCYTCHSGARDNDFVFLHSLSGGN